MKSRIIIGFITLLAIDTMCQIAFKLAAFHGGIPTFDLPWLMRILSEPWIYVVGVGYLCAFFTYMGIIKNAPIGPAFAASHLEIVTVLLVSLVWFKEHLTMTQVLGCTAIIAGVAVLALTERGESI